MQEQAALHQLPKFTAWAVCRLEMARLPQHTHLDHAGGRAQYTALYHAQEVQGRFTMSKTAP